MIAVFLAAVLWTAIAAPALAGPGHSHDETPRNASHAAAPRFGAHGDLFELVGVLEGEVVTLYLDRYATNEPITDARVEVDVGGQAAVAAPAPDGTYRVTLAGFSEPGRHLMTFTIAHKGDADLLEGAFDVAAPDQRDALPGEGRAWRYAAVGTAALALAMGIAFARIRRRGDTR